MAEVSSRVIELFPVLASRNPAIKIEALFAGLPELTDGRPWVSWNDFVEVNRRLAAIGGVPLLREAGKVVVSLQAVSPIVAVLASGLSLRTTFSMSHRWGGPSVFRPAEPFFEESADENVLVLGIRLSPEHADSPEFFQVVAGFLEELPTAVGRQRVRVDLSLEPRVGRFTVHLPPEYGFLQRVRHAFRIVFAPPRALEATSQSIYVALLEQRDEIRAQLAETERLRIEAERALRVKSDFTATVSHELRTPISAIKGTVALLQLTRLDSAQQEHVERVRSSTDHLLGIVSDLLDFSRYEAGYIPLTYEPVDLRVLLEGVAAEVLPRLVGRPVDLHLQLTSAVPPALRTDRQRLRQIVVNLVVNAIKFTEAGRVIVSADWRDGELCLEVIDTGSGVPPGNEERIFAPYQQAETGTARAASGVGLGLAICRHIVRAMEGSIVLVRHNAPGARFRVTLPCAAVPREPGPTRGVLVASDAARYLPTIAAAFGNAGYSVTAADSAANLTQLLDDRGFLVLVVGPDSQAVPTGSTRVLQIGDKPGMVAHDRIRSGVAAVIARLVSARHSLAPNTRRSILVVEDNLLNQRVAKGLLEHCGCQVRVAGNGQSGLQMVMSERFDAVFTDLHMPETDGVWLLSALRATPALHDLPVYVLTADIRPELSSDLRKLGAAAVIQKPLQMAEIQEILAGLPVRQPVAPGPWDRAQLDELAPALGDQLYKLIAEFVEGLPLALARIHTAAATGDWATCRTELHTLKGTAATFGATRLANALAEAHATIDTGDPGPLDRVMDAAQATIASAPH